MSERLAALRRIRAVQEIVRQRTDYALSAAERRKAAIEAERGDLAAFTDDAALRGDLARLAEVQGRRLAIRGDRVALEIVQRTAASRNAQARHKLTDELLQRLARDEQASTERRDLQALIDDLAVRTIPPD